MSSFIRCDTPNGNIIYLNLSEREVYDFSQFLIDLQGVIRALQGTKIFMGLMRIFWSQVFYPFQ